MIQTKGAWKIVSTLGFELTTSPSILNFPLGSKPILNYLFKQICNWPWFVCAGWRWASFRGGRGPAGARSGRDGSMGSLVWRVATEGSFEPGKKRGKCHQFVFEVNLLIISTWRGPCYELQYVNQNFLVIDLCDYKNLTFWILGWFELKWQILYKKHYLLSLSD